MNIFNQKLNLLQKHRLTAQINRLYIIRVLNYTCLKMPLKIMDFKYYNKKGHTG